MAPVSKFKNAVAAGVANSYVTVFTAPVGKDCVATQMSIANTGATGVQVSVRVFKSIGATAAHIVKAAPVPVGSSLDVLDNKVTLMVGDYIEVVCLTPGETVDVILSYIEDVNN